MSYNGRTGSHKSLFSGKDAEKEFCSRLEQTLENESDAGKEYEKMSNLAEDMNRPVVSAAFENMSSDEKAHYSLQEKIHRQVCK